MKTTAKKVRTVARTQTIKSNPIVFALNSIGSLVLFIITIGLRTKTPEILLARLRMHILKLTGNANFPTTKPTLAALQNLATDLEAAIDAIANGNMAMIPIRDSLVVQVTEAIRRLAVNIEDQSDSDPIKIQSAGFKIHKTPTPTTLPEQVINLKTAPSGPGKISLRWKKVDTALIYAIQQNTDLLNNKSPLQNPPF